MTAPRYYRGGPSLAPRPNDLRIDSATGLVRPGHGVSVQSVPDGLERFGGAFEVTNVPPNLTIVKTGRKPTHYEIAPAYPMTRAEYEDALAQIVLIPADAGGATDGSST